MTHRRARNCMVPPHILNALVKRGLSLTDGDVADRQQRVVAARNAVQTLDATNVFKTARVGLAASATANRRAARFQRGAAPPVPLSEAEPLRTIVSAENRFRTRGVEVRAEHDPPTGDKEVDEAFDGLGATFDFYRDVLQRNSIDGRGMPMVGVVHVGRKYDNAMWTGSHMVFGNGDDFAFQRFTITVDVMGHEMTHGVIDNEAGLAYWSQSGALNESIADVFGSLVKQYKRKQSARDADWLIGADTVAGLSLLEPRVNGVALRSMKAPGTAYDDALIGGKDPQPAHMKHFVRGMSDDGGVHINSGIPNKAFYLFATALGGNAYDDPGWVWYAALTSPLLAVNANFSAFASLTLAIARRRFGPRADQALALKEAWDRVGVHVP